MAANQEIKHELTCPYCMQQVDPRKVLFCRKNPDASNDASYDPPFATLQQDFLTFQSVNRRPDMGTVKQIVMDPRPKYLYFPWTKEGCPAHLQEKYNEPLDVEMASESLIPFRINVRMMHGYTPKQLLESEEIDLAQPAPEEIEPEEEDEEEENLFTSKKFNHQQKQEVVKKSTVNADETVKIRSFACPHCHGVLPEGFGKYPMYRVVLLGASGSGKTTYMTSVAHLLTESIGLPGKLIRKASLSAESEPYFKFLITCRKEAQIAATVRKEEGIREPTVFPIVLTVETQEKSFILVMNDCPGEAVADENFINNYPALEKCDGVIFIIDPLASIAEKGEDVKRNAIERLLEEEGILVTEEAIRAYHYAKEGFATTIEPFSELVTNNSLRQLRSIVMDLHKLDVVHPLLKEKGNVVPCIDKEDRSDLSQQHGNGFNMADVGETSTQLSSVIANCLEVGNYETSIDDLSKVVGPIYTLGTSTRNRNLEGRFVAPDITSEASKGHPIADADLKGFRMLEPLLCVMAQLGLVAIDTEAVASTYDDSYEPETLTFWQRLFGRRR